MNRLVYKMYTKVLFCSKIIRFREKWKIHLTTRQHAAILFEKSLEQLIDYQKNVQFCAAEFEKALLICEKGSSSVSLYVYVI